MLLMIGVCWFRLLLAFFVFKVGLAVQYSSGGITVDVTLEMVDENNSTKYCVDYLSGDAYGRDFKRACFTSFFTDGGTFRLCIVEFDDKNCTKCTPCTSGDEVGYALDCFNIEPTENSNACAVLNDQNIQEVLVDKDFDGMNLLEFNITEGIGQGSGDDNMKQQSSSSAVISGAKHALVGIIGFALIL